MRAVIFYTRQAPMPLRGMSATKATAGACRLGTSQVFFRVSEVSLGIFLKNTNRVPLTQTGEHRLLRLTIADPDDVRFAISHALPKIPKQYGNFTEQCG